MTRRLTGSLALALCLSPIGCCEVGDAGDFAERLTWDWRTGDGCFLPDPGHRQALGAAVELWAQAGGSLVRARAEPDLEICLRARHPRPGYPGWTSHPDGGPALVELNGLIAPAATPALYAHEIGHVVLHPGSGHHTGTGVLAPHVTLRLDWSPDDREFLAGLGFVLGE